MKKKLFIYMVLALPLVLCQSCLKDQEDKFDEPSAIRLQNYLTEVQDTLTNAPYGWALDYYADEERPYGGYAYGVQFTEDESAVSCELGLQGQYAITSLYSMKKDMGAVLSFDTYNSFMHFFATPSYGQYEGMKGDFEFVIDSVGDDVVKTYGKRSQNVMYWHKLNEPISSYLLKVYNNSEAFFLSSVSLSVGGENVLATIDYENRQIEFSSSTGTIATSYCFTDKGIRLYQPITINNVSIWELEYDDTNVSLTADNVTTTASYISTDYIAGLIGSISGEHTAFTKTYEIPHLDKLTIESEADWIHVSTNGDQLTVTVDENPDGNIRVGGLTISSGDNSSEITVTQCDINNVLGSYTLYFRDRDNSTETASLTLTQKSGNDIVMTITDGSRTYSMPATYDQESASVVISGGYTGSTIDLTIQGETVTTYVYSYFLSSSYESMSSSQKYSVSFNYSSTLGTYGIFNGQIGGEDIQIWLLMVAESSEATASDLLGYVMWMTTPYIIKDESTTAKSDTQTQLIPPFDTGDTNKEISDMLSQKFKCLIK